MEHPCLVILNSSNVRTVHTERRILCGKPVSGAKSVFLKRSVQCSKRPPGNYICSLLLLLGRFDGADLFILVFLITILVRHVRVFNLWGCTRSILHFKAISLYNSRFLCPLPLKVLRNHPNSLPMRCIPLTLTGPPPAFSLIVTGAFSSNSPRLTWRMMEMHQNHTGHVLKRESYRKRMHILIP